jgi:hypothetical protein
VAGRLYSEPWYCDFKQICKYEIKIKRKIQCGRKITFIFQPLLTQFCVIHVRVWVSVLERINFKIRLRKIC